MKPEFEEYLRAIEMPEAIQSKINILINQYNEIYVGELQDIFVEDLRDTTGNIEYKALHLFSEDIDHTIENFVFQDKIFIVPFKNNIDAITIDKENYNFEIANDASKLTVHFTLSGGNLSGVFYATKMNCNYLKIIIKKYLTPNLFY